MIKKFFLIILFMLFSLITIPVFAFKSNNIAYCIGNEESHTDFVVNNAKTYYTLMKYDTRTYIDPSVTLFGSMLKLNPEILIIAAHSDPRGIAMTTKNAGILVGSQNTFDSSDRLYYGVQRYSWSNSSLVILGGCYSATDDNADNICKQISDLAPNGVVIGWKDFINNVDLDKWLKRFNAAIAVGYTISEAIEQANSYSEYSNDNIKNNRSYPNKKSLSTILSKNNIKNSSVELNNSYDINYDVLYKSENDIVNINDMLKKEFEGYNPNNYELKIINKQENNEVIINLRLKINDFITNNGYVIFVKDGKVNKLYNNHTYTSKECDNLIKNENLNHIKISDYITKIEECKKIASNNIIQENKSSINTAQEAQLYYDFNLNKKFLNIITENKIENSVAYYVEQFEI